MLFRRRESPTRAEKVRLWLWPRRSWRRSGLYYLKRTVRLSGTPYAIATGAAIGAGMSCTPLFGLHVAVTLALAWLVGASLVAGAIGTCIGNPITYPVLWGASFELGRILLGEPGSSTVRIEHDLLHHSWSGIWPVFKPMLLGSLPIGAAVGCIVFAVVYKAAAAYEGVRLDRLAVRQGRGRAQGVRPDISRTGRGS